MEICTQNYNFLFLKYRNNKNIRCWLWKFLTVRLLVLEWSKIFIWTGFYIRYN